MLKRKGIPHHVLNAKIHEREAEIVAQAGRYKAVTISTNMAGRGTDILLGGNPVFLARMLAKGKEDEETYAKALEEAKAICEKEKEQVIAEGGLHILGTERHESRRIDNQLRGRSGRQGDPGSSRFYVSLEDEIMRIFGSDRISPLLGKLGMEEDMPIEHRLITKAIENAQTRVEGHNFEIRKYLLEYDNVMNKQRETIYGMRKEIINDGDIRERVVEMVEEHRRRLRRRVCPGEGLPGRMGHRLPQEPDLRDLFLPHRPRPSRPEVDHEGGSPRHGEGPRSVPSTRRRRRNSARTPCGT